MYMAWMRICGEMSGMAVCGVDENMWGMSDMDVCGVNYNIGGLSDMAVCGVDDNMWRNE